MRLPRIVCVCASGHAHFSFSQVTDHVGVFVVMCAADLIYGRRRHGNRLLRQADVEHELSHWDMFYIDL